jgi:hypothetical protein
MHKQAEPSKGRAAAGQTTSVARPPAPHPYPSAVTGAQVAQLQRLAGNRAVASHLGAAVPVQREEAAPATLEQAIDDSDPDALKAFRPFPPLSASQVRKISRLVIDKNTWIGPDDEATLEAAWRAVAGDRDKLTKDDWTLWKECEGYGAELKLVPWMSEARATFADKVCTNALHNVDANTKAVQDEAKRLGIGLDDSAQPAPAQENDAAIAEQRGLAAKLKQANEKLRQLRTIPVGYGPPSWGASGGKPDQPPGGIAEEIEPKQVVNFDPEQPPFSRAEPDPNPDAGIAKYEVVKAMHAEMNAAIAEILEKNPALYAIAARGSTDALLGEDTAAVRAQMSTALRDVLANAAKTKAEIEGRSLRFSEMVPVHRSVLEKDPQFQNAFASKLANDFIKDEEGDEAAANKLVSLVTIALITAVEVASGGTATPVVGALISLASSAGTAAASWNDWAKLENAAKSTVSDRTAVVTQEQADGAKLGAMISTAVALLDVYGVGKAVNAAAGAKAAVAALEGRVNDAAQLKSIAQGVAVPNAREVVERSVTSLGPAATARSVGGWQKLATTLGESSEALGKLKSWRAEVFNEAEEAAAKAAVGQQGEAARAALALASGIEQVAVGEALDAVIEVFTDDDAAGMGQVAIGGTRATLDPEELAAQAAAKHPVAFSKSVQRRLVEIVELPISELKLAAMSPAEFERIIRTHVSAGRFEPHGLPPITVLEGKLDWGDQGFDGLGIAKENKLIQLYNLECKYVAQGSTWEPTLHATKAGTQGGQGWAAEKARLMLSGANPFADETLEDLTVALRRRIGAFDERLLEETLADGLRRAHFVAFTPVWAKTDHLLAKLRGLISQGAPVKKLFRIAPKGWK